MDHKGSQFFSLLVVALFVCLSRVATATAASTKSPVWLSTQGRHIIDGHTKQVYKLRCASWSGAQEKWYVASGLWAQHRSAIAQKVRSDPLGDGLWGLASQCHELCLRVAKFPQRRIRYSSRLASPHEQCDSFSLDPNLSLLLLG